MPKGRDPMTTTVLYVGHGSDADNDDAITHVDVEIDGMPGWVVRVVPELTERGVEIGALAIRPAEEGKIPEGGLTANVLRNLPIRKMQLAARTAALVDRQLFGDARGLDKWIESGPVRPGRTGRPAAFYALWAAEYVDAVAGSKSPVKDLATKHSMSAGQLRGLLNQARKRGLLTEASAGRPGGELTAKARELLGMSREGQQ